MGQTRVFAQWVRQEKECIHTHAHTTEISLYIIYFCDFDHQQKEVSQRAFQATGKGTGRVNIGRDITIGKFFYGRTEQHRKSERETKRLRGRQRARERVS